MKLILTIEAEHDLLDIPTLLLVLPEAIDAVRRSTSAGIGATGPDGIRIQVPGTSALARVGFRLAFAETAQRIADLPVE